MQKTGNLDLYVKDIYILDMQIDRFLVLKTEKEEKKGSFNGDIDMIKLIKKLFKYYPMNK